MYMTAIIWCQRRIMPVQRKYCVLSLIFFTFLVGEQGRERGRRFWKDFKDDPERDGTI